MCGSCGARACRPSAGTPALTLLYADSALVRNSLLVPPDDGRLAAEIPGYRANAVARALLTAVLDLADRWLLHRCGGSVSSTRWASPGEEGGA
ncbi:MAG: hypothetical protein AB1816_18085 [Bacillota bacterium]|nr:hypothetical protein [Bacillota bacterium]MDI7249311.1 hypothetical protein [Bacillota bacterium]